MVLDTRICRKDGTAIVTFLWTFRTNSSPYRFRCPCFFRHAFTTDVLSNFIGLFFWLIVTFKSFSSFNSNLWKLFYSARIISVPSYICPCQQSQVNYFFQIYEWQAGYFEMSSAKHQIPLLKNTEAYYSCTLWRKKSVTYLLVCFTKIYIFIGKNNKIRKFL